jgi:hypothetical protein
MAKARMMENCMLIDWWYFGFGEVDESEVNWLNV